MSNPVAVVGLGADGWQSISGPGRQALLDADVVLGSSRQLDLLPPEVTPERKAWGSPLRDSIRPLLEAAGDRKVVAVASGDPLHAGLATTMIDVLGADQVIVMPAVSSSALAHAAMCWPVEQTVVLRDHRELPRHLATGAKIVVLSQDASTPETVAAMLTAEGWGDSLITVLGDLGSANESRRTITAAKWTGKVPALNVLAIEVSGPAGLGLLPGLPDDAFEHDGQLTKRDVRISALSRLAPARDQYLWDVGAGAGSIGIEWARAHPSCRVTAIEQNATRAARIRRNAARLGTPTVEVVEGAAPGALQGLPQPDAVFIGGGASRPGVIDACWDALAPGGRLVIHAVTIETETELARRQGLLGGELTRISIEQAAAIGGFRGWTPARAVVQWSIVKDGAAHSIA